MARKAINDEKKNAIDIAFRTMLRQNKLLDPDIDLSSALNLIIDAPLVIFVDSVKGDDSFNGRTQDFAYKTIQAALDSLLNYEIRELVTINVAAGTYDGFFLGGHQVSYSKTNVLGTPGIKIQGTTALSTVTTGSNQGTATSKGASGTFTDTTQSWTVNDLKGKFVTFVGSGVNYPIISNTATTITCPTLTSFSGFPSNQYQILDNVSIVTCNANIPTFSAGTTSGMVIGNESPFSASGILIQNFSITVSTAQIGVLLRSNNSIVTLREMTINSSTNSSFSMNSGTLAMSRMALISSGTAAVFSNPANSVPIAFNIAESYVWQKNTGTGTALGLSLGSILCSSILFEGWGTVISNIESAAGTAAPNAVRVALISHACINCTTVISSAAPNFYANIGAQNGFPITESGNTNYVVVSRGGRVKILSTATLQATNEITIDGAVTTIAALRAASPTALPSTPNVWGTVVYQ
jgi:hypothetical protein